MMIEGLKVGDEYEFEIIIAVGERMMITYDSYNLGLWRDTYTGSPELLFRFSQGEGLTELSNLLDVAKKNMPKSEG